MFYPYCVEVSCVYFFIYHSIDIAYLENSRFIFLELQFIEHNIALSLILDFHRK